MQYLKRNTKYSILIFLAIVLAITVSISTLAKTEIHFSLYDNSQTLSTTSPNPEVQTKNFNTSFQDELVKISQISESLAQKIITLRNELDYFKEPKDLLKIPELTNIDLREWKEEGIHLTVIN